MSHKHSLITHHPIQTKSKLYRMLYYYWRNIFIILLLLFIYLVNKTGQSERKTIITFNNKNDVIIIILLIVLFDTMSFNTVNNPQYQLYKITANVSLVYIKIKIVQIYLGNIFKNQYLSTWFNHQRFLPVQLLQLFFHLTYRMSLNCIIFFSLCFKG